MANMIELKQVSKEYGTDVKTKVLHEVDLSIEEGSFTSIIGQSGSGKSTLLNIVGTLDRPTNGEVYIGGKRTDQMKKRAGRPSKRDHRVYLSVALFVAGVYGFGKCTDPFPDSVRAGIKKNGIMRMNCWRWSVWRRS